MNESFYASWAEHYDAVFPVGPKARFVSGHLPPAARVLDVGCATGGVDFELATFGHSVHGIDLEPSLVDRATARLDSEACARVSFAVGDMLALTPPPRPFDAVLCLGNTFVHLLAGPDRVAALAGMGDQVGPDGRLVLQIVNYDRILRDGVRSLPLIDNDRVRFERRYVDVGPERLTFEADLTVKATDVTRSASQPLVPLTRAQLDAELRAAGWQPEAWFGGYGGAPWSPESFGCIVVGRRTG
jgi:glycine/sarcosine N-methyltransferase